MRSVQLVGRLGRDAEIKYTPSGTPVANFSIAVDAGKKNDNKQTLWVNCTLWEKRAESLAPYLIKGKMVAVEATLEEPRCWISKQSGEAQCSLNVTVRNLTFCGGAEKKAEPEASDPRPGLEVTDEDIPF
jgi:single-strand DNA-binding protein